MNNIKKSLIIIFSVISLGFLLIPYHKVYALESVTPYGSNSGGSPSASGYFNTRLSPTGNIVAGQLNTLYSDRSYLFSTFINKSVVVNKTYKIRLNYNDYDFNKNNNSTYVKIQPYNSDEAGSYCTIVSFTLLNQGGVNNQAKGVDIEFLCGESGSYFFISIAKFDDVNDVWKNITTIDWRLNSIQWEQVQTDGTQDIINNQTNNTQNIINNDNTNTQNIINNQNEIAEQQHEDQLVCELIDKNNIELDNKSLGGNAIVSDNNLTGITNYIQINKAKIYVMDVNVNTYWASCLYDKNKTKTRCFNNDTLTINQEITPTENEYFFRATIVKSSNLPQFKICKNGNQATTDAINDLNKNLTDTSSVDMNSLGNTAGWLPAGPIDSIVNLPLTMLNNIFTALSGSCSPLTITIPFIHTQTTIPCLSTIFGQINGVTEFWTWVGTIASIIILYSYFINLYNYYDRLTTLQANYLDDFGGTP